MYMIINKHKYSEYYNVNTVLNEQFEEKKYSLDIDNVIKRYRDTGEIGHIVIDQQLLLQENPEIYFAAKKIGLKAVPGRRAYKDIVNFPPRVSIELTNRCNSACKMCPRNAMTRDVQDMDITLFERLLSEIHLVGTNSVYLYRLGESLLHPQFPLAMQLLNQYNNVAPTWLSTNGMLLTPENRRVLLESDITFLNVSINALDKINYEKINEKVSYDCLINNLTNLIEEKKKTSRRTPFLRGQIIEQVNIPCDYVEFIERWGDEFDILHFGFLEEFAGQLPDNVIEKEDVSHIKCQRMLRDNELHIYSNGDAVICICDINAQYFKVGNVYEKTLAEIWNGESKKKLLDMHSHGEDKHHPLCGVCHDRIL